MKRDETNQSEAVQAPAIKRGRYARAGNYTKVRTDDKHKRAIRGLWVRNGRYYAQLQIADTVTGSSKVRRVPLEGATTVAQARDALEKLKLQRNENTLPQLGLSPKFSDYADQFVERSILRKKRPRTISAYRLHAKHWKKRLGDTRLNRITRAQVSKAVDAMNAEFEKRTVNMAVTILGMIFRRAIDDGLMKEFSLRGLRHRTTPKRELVEWSHQDIQSLWEAALTKDESGRFIIRAGQQVSDYIKLLAYTGMRRDEGVSVSWKDVNFEKQQLTVKHTKNGKERKVDFTPNLGEHLQDMAIRKVPDSKWIFPSVMQKHGDRHVSSFKSMVDQAKDLAVAKSNDREEQHTAERLSRFTIRECRNFFISFCVMSGIDYMTIADWVGHSDGGVLIGKTYGYIRDDHKKNMAAKVSFGPSVLEGVA